MASTVGIAFSSLVVLHKLGIHPYAKSAISSEEISQSPVVHTPSAASIERIVFGEHQEKRSPIRLRILKINVEAAVLYAGLTPSGAMDVPASPNDVAWFNLGPRPGERGSAVISGHYGWKNGTPAVFDNLHKLTAGDRIVTEDEAGSETTFVVRELRKLKEHEDASVVFASNDGEAHLNLVTCGGKWNKEMKSYSERLVVFADKTGE